MLISGREAAALLARQGLSLSASQQLLRTGIAGAAVRAGNVLLYDQGAVERLAGAAAVRGPDVAGACPHGHLVARLPRGARMLVDAPWDEQAAVIAGPWRLDVKVRTILRVMTIHGWRVPLVATVAGFAVGGGEILGVEPHAEGDRRSTFTLAPPRGWLDLFFGRPCSAGRGRQTMLRGWPLQQ